MENSETHNPRAHDTAPRRPRVAILGEFSAGKSTLINMMTGGAQLRTQVTATQMPAIWMSHGTGEPFAVDLEGNERPVDLSDPSTISVTEIAYIRVFMETPILTLCDLIDTPGNSDPNIAPIAWERIAEIADIAVWCSPSTQAWRQSELAAWKDVPERVREQSILLLTRADKLLTEEDRSKVLRRVTREAGSLFSKVHMASLLDPHEVQPPVRDLVDLCRSIETAETPGSPDAAAVLSGMFRSPGAVTEQPALPVKEADEDEDSQALDEVLDMAAADVTTDIPELELESEPELEPEPKPKARASEPGFGTALWHDLTKNVAVDDFEALDAAFHKFLATIDSEVAMLRDVANIKLAS